MSVLYWIHVKCLTCTEHMSVCERCLSCSSWPFHLIFPSVLLLMWSNEAGASVGIRHGPDRGGQNKQSKANMAGPFKCGSQVHAQTHTRKPQTHFCQRGERPSYRRLQRDRNDGLRMEGLNRAPLACALLAGLLIVKASLPDSPLCLSRSFSAVFSWFSFCSCF